MDGAERSEEVLSTAVNTKALPMVDIKISGTLRIQLIVSVVLGESIFPMPSSSNSFFLKREKFIIFSSVSASGFPCCLNGTQTTYVCPTHVFIITAPVKEWTNQVVYISFNPTIKRDIFLGI